MTKSSQNSKNVHDGHRDRMRSRFLKVGLDGFNEHEILEFILFHAIARIDTNELAHELISKFGSLTAVLNAPVSELTKVKGIGKNSAILIRFICDLMKSDLSSRKNIEPLDTSEKVGAYVRPLFDDFSVEKVVVVALDTNLRPISSATVAEGCFDKAIVSPTKVARFLLACGAEKAILAHNHPHGIAMPSVADIRATTALKTALDSIGVPLVDHIVVVKDDFTSLRDSGNRIYTTIE